MANKKMIKLEAAAQRRDEPSDNDEAEAEVEEMETEEDGGESTISDVIKEQKINDIIRFILKCQQRNATIKRADITRDVLKVYKSHFVEFFKEACSRLEKIAGIKIRELNTKRNCYVALNALAPDIKPVVDGDENACQQTALLGVILTFLYMKSPEDTCVNEKDVLKFLRKLGIDPNKTANHSTFGDVKKMISREIFSTQRDYVRIQKRQTSDGQNDVFWMWGERAKNELSKMNSLKAFCRITRDEVNIESWTTHFRVAIIDVEQQR